MSQKTFLLIIKKGLKQVCQKTLQVTSYYPNLNNLGILVVRKRNLLHQLNICLVLSIPQPDSHLQGTLPSIVASD